MNIVAYCRVSTDTSDQLNSLEAQKTFFQEFADKNGHNLISIYADEGISGTKIKNRKEFQKLLNDAKHGLFEMVVVKDISRFARNTVDLLNSTRQLKEYSIETTFITSNMTILGQSEFVLTIFGALAQEESANTSKRVKFGKKANAEKGRVPNIVYGYDKTKGDYFNLKINENEAAVVRRMFDLYINHGCGSNKIAQALNKDNVKTKRDCKWSQHAVGRILTNEIYTGKIINGKEEVTDFLTSKREKKSECDWNITLKPDLRIISDEIFQKAQDILAKRNVDFNINKERQSNRHLFSTLIRCNCCGYSFRQLKKIHTNKTYIKWVCSGRNSNGKDFCNNKIKIDEEELINVLKEYFLNIVNTKENSVTNIVKEFNKIYKTEKENVVSEKELNKKLAKANKSRQKYMEMYEDELISREELRIKLASLNSEIEKCENELKLVKYNLNKGDELESVLSKTFNSIENMVAVDQMTNTQLKEIIEKITVEENGNVNIYLKLLSDIGLEQKVLVSDYRT